MTTYRSLLETEMIAELRAWLDITEARHGPVFGVDAFAFVAAVSFTPIGDDFPPIGDDAPEGAYARRTISYRGSQCDRSVQLQMLREAVALLEDEALTDESLVDARLRDEHRE